MYDTKSNNTHVTIHIKLIKIQNFLKYLVLDIDMQSCKYKISNTNI